MENGIVEKGTSFFGSKANLLWVTFAAIAVMTHVVLRQFFPAFIPPASADKPGWIKSGIYAEGIIHLTILGAAVTGCQNAIPWWARPRYSDDGTLDIRSEERPNSDLVQWTSIVVIVLETGIYVVTWLLIYGIVKLG